MNGVFEPWSRLDVLTGAKFDGTPLSIEISSKEPFGRGGGSAGIYLGETLEKNPLAVAVKAFSPLGLLQKQLLERELSAARQVSMRHQFILPFLGTVDIGDLKAIVSLYMKNGNLLAFVKANPGCDKQRLLLQVADAVNYLHRDEGLVHGDLKCANVLVSDSQDALLGDFGLSTFVQKAHAEPETVTGIRQMNTVRFAAPELLVFGLDPHAKPPSKTYESDVYAFGMLVLEAVIEKPPWPDAGDIAVVLQVLAGNRPHRPTSAGSSSISLLWWDMCCLCWSHSPGDRPAMDQVLTVLTSASLEHCESPFIASDRSLDGPEGRWLEGHSDTVWSVAYLPDGRRVASGSRDGAIRVWDIYTGRTTLGPLYGHRDIVRCVAVSPKGSRICSGGEDGTIRRWDAEYGASLGEPMTGHDGFVHAVAFSPDGLRIVSCSSDETVRLWDATTGEALGDPLRGTQNPIFSVAFSPDGACIAAGSIEGSICLWDSTTRVTLGILRQRSPAYSVCFSPDRVHLVAGYDDGFVRIWNIATQELAHSINAHSHAVSSVSISPCGTYIASGSFDASICIWDAQNGDAVEAPLTGHTSWVNSVAFSPNGDSLVSGSDDGTVCIWDIFE